MMRPTLSSSTLVVAFLALAATTYIDSCDAYAFVNRPATSNSRSTSYVPSASSASPAVITRFGTTILRMAEEDETAEGGETAATDDAPAAAEEAPPAAPEDPEVTAIKAEIADLESTLKEKKSQILYLQDAADLNSKAGYARKVAEMENMRRARSVSLTIV